MPATQTKASGLLVGTLFVSAAGAFSVSAYALGVWLALGCATVAAYAALVTHFADRPATVAAISALDASLALALAETNTRLKELEGKTQFVVTNISALGGAGQAAGRLRSPLRPPNGVR
jgi:drug/metabolite transporter (DMT)-like permease